MNQENMNLVVHNFVKTNVRTADPSERKAMLATFREFPAQAIVAIRQNDAKNGLTTWASANVLDDIVGEIKDPEEARRLVEENLELHRRAELLMSRGDLPSTLAFVVSLDDICLCLAQDLQDVSSTLPDHDGEDAEEVKVAKDKVDRQRSREFVAYAAFYLRAWAIKLRDRTDYRDFLHRIIAGRPVRQHLLWSVWVAAGQPKTLSDFPLDLLDEVGLGDEEHLEELWSMIGSNSFPRLTPERLKQTQDRLEARRAAREKTSKLDQEGQDEVRRATDAANF